MREGRASDLVIISPPDLVCWISLFHLEMGHSIPEWEIAFPFGNGHSIPWMGDVWRGRSLGSCALGTGSWRVFDGTWTWTSFRCWRSDQHRYLWAPNTGSCLTRTWEIFSACPPLLLPAELWYICFRAGQSFSVRVNFSRNALCFSALVH